MGRIRSIKPDFFLDEELAELPALHRLLFAGLWTQADRRGRLEDRPRRIKAAVLPYDDLDVDSALQMLHERDFIQRYEVEGERYIVVTAFEKHQRISGKESQIDSEIPAPPPKRKGKQRGSTREAPEQHPGAQEGKGRERKGKERETPVSPALPGLDSAPATPEPEKPDLDLDVYARWRELWAPRAGPRLDDKRRSLIRKRRAERPSDRAQQDLLDSLAGWANDTWPERPQQAKLEQLLRDAGQVDKGLALFAQGPPRPKALAGSLVGRASDIDTRPPCVNHPDLRAMDGRHCASCFREVNGLEAPA